MSALHKLKAKYQNDRSAFLLFGIWLLWSFLMLVFSARTGGELMTDPDDFMRMTQVKDWLAGQSWLDVTQYRIHPPEGGSMHWSRWLDVPIATILVLAGSMFPPQMADLIAITAIPLILFGALILLVFCAVRELANEKIALLAAFLIPTCPLIFRQFLPGRVDHHSWQILMAALALFAFFRHKSNGGAYLLGAALAFWMHISIEGLPYAAIFGSILAIFYVFPKLSEDGSDDDRLIHFLNAMTLISVALMASTQTPSSWLIRHCDAVSWPLLLSLTAVSIGMNIAHFLARNRSLPIKIGLIGLVGLAGLAVFFAYSDTCALNPFGQLSPLVQSFWHESISEGLPISRQASSIISLLISVPVIFLVWITCLLSKSHPDFDKKKWLSLTFLVICASLLSFGIQRTAGVAELFALPGLAALISMLVLKVQTSGSMIFRVTATVAVIVGLTPMTFFVAGDALSANVIKNKSASVPPRGQHGCAINTLRSLEPGLIFTTMAAGPEILYRTRHSVYTSGYHRNHRIMHRLIATMLGPTENAYRTLSDSNVRYVAFCPTHFEAQSYLRASKRGFAATLMTDKIPTWLKPVPEFANSEMRVFRFEKRSAN